MKLFSDPTEGIKRVISEQGEQIQLLQKTFTDHVSQEIKLDLVECEKCGCLLNKTTAIKGEGEVRQKFEGLWYRHLVDYIYYPFYCKIHQPKDKK